MINCSIWSDEPRFFSHEGHLKKGKNKTIDSNNYAASIEKAKWLIKTENQLLDLGFSVALVRRFCFIHSLHFFRYGWILSLSSPLILSWVLSLSGPREIWFNVLSLSFPWMIWFWISSFAGLTFFFFNGRFSVYLVYLFSLRFSVYLALENFFNPPF